MFNCIECGEQIKSPALTGQWDCLKCHDELIERCRTKAGTAKGLTTEKIKDKIYFMNKKGMTNLTEMARQIGVDPSTVRYHYKRMELRK